MELDTLHWVLILVTAIALGVAGWFWSLLNQNDTASAPSKTSTPKRTTSSAPKDASDDYEKKITALRSELSDAKSSLKKAESGAEEQKSSLTEQKTKVKNLKNEVKSLKQQLKSAQNTNASNKTANKSANAMREELAQAKEEAAEATFRAEQAEKALAKLESDAPVVDEPVIPSGASDEEIASLRKEHKRKLDEAANAHKAELKALKSSKSKDVKAARTELRAEINDVRSKMKKARRDLESERRRSENAEKAYKIVQLQLDAALEKLALLQSPQVNGEEPENARLKQKLEQAKLARSGDNAGASTSNAALEIPEAELAEGWNLDAGGLGNLLSPKKSEEQVEG